MRESWTVGEHGRHEGGGLEGIPPGDAGAACAILAVTSRREALALGPSMATDERPHPIYPEPRIRRSRALG
jgi:hypothetical protein